MPTNLIQSCVRDIAQKRPYFEVSRSPFSIVSYLGKMLIPDHMRKSMFAQLPETLKKEVLYHLENNNFPKAKAIHDAWLGNRNILKKLLKEDSK